LQKRKSWTADLQKVKLPKKNENKNQDFHFSSKEKSVCVKFPDFLDITKDICDVIQFEMNSLCPQGTCLV